MDGGSGLGGGFVLGHCEILIFLIFLKGFLY